MRQTGQRAFDPEPLRGACGVAAVLALLGPTLLACGSGDSAFAPTGGTNLGGSGGAGGVESTSTSTSGGVGGAGAEGGGGAPGPFALEVHTELDGPALVLRCNLPRTVSDCTASAPADAPCADSDADGLVDAWEDVVIDRFRPLVRFDEAESLLADSGAVTATVARVAPAGELVHAFITLGYSRDYGSCGGISAHNGDSERVALELEQVPDGGPCDVRVRRAYTAAHEGTATDHGRLFDAASLGELTHAIDSQHGEPRWVVFSSQDKHATYASVAICEGISQVPCFDEDCGADGVPDPTTYERLFAFANAGEELTPLLTDLSGIGFAGEDAWADQDFCGGLGGLGCASSVRAKLLDSPF